MAVAEQESYIVNLKKEGENKMSFWKNKKVLVTGAGGFIGSHFIEEFAALNIYVVGSYFRSVPGTFGNRGKIKRVKLDLLNFSRVLSLCKKEKIDIILHCAALDGNIEFKMKNSARIMNENMRMVSNILDVAKDLKIKDVMLTSSAEIYSPQVKSPIIEEDDHEKFFHYSENGYVLAKIFSEVLGKLYAKQFGVNVFLPRPTNAYGPGDEFDTSTNRVIPSMIQKALHGEQIEIWGNGRQIRGFIYVNDLVKSILLMIESRRYQTLNIATKESISILNLAKTISRIIGVKPNIHLDTKKPAGIKERVLSVKKLNSIINFTPRSLEEGLAETIDWYKNVYGTK